MIKRKNYETTMEYLDYLRDDPDMSVDSIDRYWFSLRILLEWADEVLLQDAASIRPGFSSYVASLPGRRGETHLAAESQKKILNQAKKFYEWAKIRYPRDFRKIGALWLKKLKRKRMPDESGDFEYVTLEQVKALIEVPADENDYALRRDKAAAALLFVSGARAKALATLPIKAVKLDCNHPHILQWPDLGVQTKFGKKGTTYLWDIPDLLNVIREWDQFVRTHLSDDARWYTPIGHTWGNQELGTGKEVGANRSVGLEKRIRALCKKAGTPIHSPHDFRRGYAVYGLKHCYDMADFKAMSNNMMHKDIGTTNRHYANMSMDDVGEQLAKISHHAPFQFGSDLLAYLATLTKKDLSEVLKDLNRAIAEGLRMLGDL